MREHYHLVASSATDLAWLDAIPMDRPALLIAEGVSMYLTESDGIALLRRVVERFPAGELQLDFWSRFGSVRKPCARTTESYARRTRNWDGLSTNPTTSLAPSRELAYSGRSRCSKPETVQRLTKGYQRFAKVASRTPVLRTIVQFHRYAF